MNVNVREELFIKYLMQGNNQTDAYILARYSTVDKDGNEKSRQTIGFLASRVAYRVKQKITNKTNKMRGSFTSALQVQGINNNRIAKKYNYLLDCTYPKYDKDGRHIAEVPDHGAQEKALDMIHKVRGDYIESEDKGMDIRIILNAQSGTATDITEAAAQLHILSLPVSQNQEQRRTADTVRQDLGSASKIGTSDSPANATGSSDKDSGTESPAGGNKH